MSLLKVQQNVTMVQNLWICRTYYLDIIPQHHPCGHNRVYQLLGQMFHTLVMLLHCHDSSVVKDRLVQFLPHRT